MLTLAAIIFAATMIVARGLAPHSEQPADAGTQRFAGFLVLLVLFLPNGLISLLERKRIRVF